MFCSNCGSQMLEGAKFCQKCGTKLNADTNVEIQSRLTEEPVNTKDKTQENSDQSNITGENVGYNTSNSNEKVIPKKLIFGIVIVVVIICGVFALLASDHKDKYIEIVKMGILEAYPQKMVGEAFNDYLDHVTWESGLSEDGQRFVNVRGEILYLDNNAEIVVQFLVDKDDETFTYNACEMDGVPQNDYFVWMLFENVYGDDSDKKTFDTEADINSEGRTKSYNNEFGNISVTLDYAEFVNQIESAMGEPIYPDEDCIFLRIVVTVENIGTETGGLPMGWNEVVYDGTYEFSEYWNTEVANDDRYDLSEMEPLTTPKTGVLIFMVPISVVDSDKPLALNINDISGETAISYEINPELNASSQSNANITRDTAGNNAASEDNICFNDIPVSDLLNSSAMELVQRFGGSYYADGEGRISYDEIEFYMLDDETVEYIWSFSLECFSINGNALNVNDEGVIYKDEIIELLGTVYEDESLSSGYYMTYYYPTYSVSFGVNKFSEVSDIRIYNLATGNSDYSGNVSGTYQEPIENYWKLSGSYSDSTGSLTLSLSIYSSQEEGEIEIGSADIYASNGQHYVGSVTPVEKNVYKIATDTGEEVLLVEEDYGDIIMLQLYVDGQYLGEYQMVEHYES